MYFEQSSMFERELTPTQERLLLHFDQIGRTPKQIRAFLNEYASAIERAGHPDQAGMFGAVEHSKDELVDRIIANTRPKAKAA